MIRDRRVVPACVRTGQIWGLPRNHKSVIAADGGTASKRSRSQVMSFVSGLSLRVQHSVSRALKFARHELGVVVALGVIAGGLVAFMDLAEDLVEGDNQSFDEAVLAWTHPFADTRDAIGPDWLQTAMLDFTALGSLAVLVLFALIAVGFLLMQKKPWSALMLSLALGGGLALSEVMKGLFERGRPPEIYQAVETINASFPSGHTLMSTVFYLTLGVMLERVFARRRLKIYVISVAILIAILVGISRVYLAAHWASDVLAGWSLGAAWAMICWLVAYWIQRHQAKRGLSMGQIGGIDGT